VFAWTGNEAQIVDLSTYELERQDLSSEGLYETAKREGVALIETGVKAFIRSFVERGGRGA
jgi:hypothetical protein